VLGVVDCLGFVDQHHRNIVTDGITPLEPGVVEARLVLEVEKGAFVFRTGEYLEKLGI